jgi:hypothetical protein
VTIRYRITGRWSRAFVTFRYNSPCVRHGIHNDPSGRGCPVRPVPHIQLRSAVPAATGELQPDDTRIFGELHRRIPVRTGAQNRWSPEWAESMVPYLPEPCQRHRSLRAAAHRAARAVQAGSMSAWTSVFAIRLPSPSRVFRRNGTGREPVTGTLVSCLHVKHHYRPSGLHSESFSCQTRSSLRRGSLRS